MTFELLATSLFGTLLAVAVTKTASSLHSQKNRTFQFWWRTFRTCKLVKLFYQ